MEEQENTHFFCSSLRCFINNFFNMNSTHVQNQHERHTLTREIRTRVRESGAFSMTIHFRVKTKVTHADTSRNCHLEASQAAEASCETRWRPCFLRRPPRVQRHDTVTDCLTVTAGGPVPLPDCEKWRFHGTTKRRRPGNGFRTSALNCCFACIVIANSHADTSDDWMFATYILFCMKCK